MENQLIPARRRIHPLVATAAVAVTAVSLLGMAAITGVVAPSHGMVASAANASPHDPRPAAVMAPSGNDMTASPIIDASGRRYVTADGQILEVVPHKPALTSLVENKKYSGNGQHHAVRSKDPVVHHRAVHYYAHSNGQDPQYVQNIYHDSQPSYQSPPAQSHPVLNYVNDMHPVGTGVGAVIGGLLGNQVGGGNGRKIATVAGALLGGYSGNEVAHNRNPLAW